MTDAARERVERALGRIQSLAMDERIVAEVHIIAAALREQAEEVARLTDRLNNLRDVIERAEPVAWWRRVAVAARREREAARVQRNTAQAAVRRLRETIFELRPDCQGQHDECFVCRTIVLTALHEGART